MGGEGAPRSELPAQLFGALVRMVLLVAAICTALILFGVFR
jgi:hypothetical protein